MTRFWAIFCVAVFFIVPASAEDAVCENKFAVLEANFDGARMSECKANRRSFSIEIEPENEPINPSPWYAFRVTPKGTDDFTVTLRYSGFKHRYRPKVSDAPGQWRLLDESRVRERRRGRKVVLRLPGGDSPYIVSAQELLGVAAYDAWMGNLAQHADVTLKQIGASVEGRKIEALFSAPAEDDGAKEDGEKEYVILVGRQHPPELTGAFMMLPFVETVFADTPLAEAFRARFHIIAAPLLNPDGVAHGYWRHNVNGVDLNRDWGPFTQPETQAMKRILDDIEHDETADLTLLLDFHSTNRNVFYTQTDEDITNPANFADLWLAATRGRVYEFEHAPRALSELNTSKNYVFKTFGAPSITFELGDQTDRDAIRASASVFAEEMMNVLLAE